MTQSEVKFTNLLAKIMIAIGGLGALVTVVLRVWISPAVINSTNGVLDSPWIVMGFMIVCLLGMLALSFFTRGIHREVAGGPCIALAASLLAAALVLIIGEIDGLLNTDDTMQMIQSALGVFSALALGVLAWRLLSERSTRRGMSQWTMLLPVLWMWMRIINYEMSYNSLARLEDSFFSFAMLVFELMFLFKFARYVAGVGQVRTGSLFFYSSATVLFALSGSLVKILLHAMDDGMSVQAYGLAGAGDLAVSLMALAMGIAYLYGTEPEAPDEPTEEEAFPVEGELIITSDESEPEESAT